MFLTFTILVIYVINPSICASTTPSTTTLSFEEEVQKELSPIKDNLRKIVNLTNSDEKLELKGEVQGKVEKIIERAVNAERKNLMVVKNMGVEIGRLTEEKDEALRLIIPLSIRNKATRIENRHPEIKGTIPPEIMQKTKPFEKHIIQRQYQWMELLNCNDDFYIQKLQKDLKVAYSNMKNNIACHYEEFKLNFCYAIATMLEEVNKNIADFEFEGMEQPLDLGVNDPVLNPYIAIFYNSVVARGENIVFSSTNVVSSSTNAVYST